MKRDTGSSMTLIQLAIEAELEIEMDHRTGEVAIMQHQILVAVVPNEEEAKHWLFGYIVGKRVGPLVGISAFNRGMLFAWSAQRP